MLLLRSPAARRNAAVAVGCAGAACIATITQQQPPSHSAAAASLRGMFLGGGASANTKGNIHLRYFDARGAAETSRLLMALVGKPFTEDRWAIDFTRLSGDQMSPGMAAARQEGKLVANLDRARTGRGWRRDWAIESHRALSRSPPRAHGQGRDRGRAHRLLLGAHPCATSATLVSTPLALLAPRRATPRFAPTTLLLSIATCSMHLSLLPWQVTSARSIRRPSPPLVRNRARRLSLNSGPARYPSSSSCWSAYAMAAAVALSLVTRCRMLMFACTCSQMNTLTTGRACKRP
jgi:hypothetical protein